MSITSIERVVLGEEEVFPGKVYDWGMISVNEDEVIRFAQSHDPLWLHTDPEAAANGPWKRIIASGPMLFSEFHRRFWIPKFGGTVIGGMNIQNWEFLKPHFPDANIRGVLKVEAIQPKAEATAAIKWDYRFYDHSYELMQSAQFTVLHTIGGFKWTNKK